MSKVIYVCDADEMEKNEEVLKNKGMGNKKSTTTSGISDLQSTFVDTAYYHQDFIGLHKQYLKSLDQKLIQKLTS